MHKRVLNTTSTTKAKKKRAKRAFLLLFMLKYITSIVLWDPQSMWELKTEFKKKERTVKLCCCT